MFHAAAGTSSVSLLSSRLCTSGGQDSLQSRGQLLLRDVRHAVQVRRRSTLLHRVVVLGVVAVCCLVERSTVRDRRQVEGGWRDRDGVGRAGRGRVGALEGLALGYGSHGGLFSLVRSLWAAAPAHCAWHDLLTDQGIGALLLFLVSPLGDVRLLVHLFGIACPLQRGSTESVLAQIAGQPWLNDDVRRRRCKERTHVIEVERVLNLV